MKKCVCILLIMFLTTLCSCTAAPKIAKHEESKVVPSGKLTALFKNYGWTKTENYKKNADFKIINQPNFDASKMTLIDVYDKSKSVFEIMQDESGKVNYYKIGNADKLEKVTSDEALDKVILKSLGPNEELWGFQEYKDFVNVIKNTGAVTYKDGNVVMESDGTSCIGDLDNDGRVELITRNDDGSNLSIYTYCNNAFNKIWEYESSEKEFDGNIQIGDLNGDGVNEFYVGDIIGTMRKFILTKDGISEDFNRPIIKDSSNTDKNYYLVDYNNDGKTDIVAAYYKMKPEIYLQK